MVPHKASKPAIRTIFLVFSLQLYSRSTASLHAESSHHVMEDVKRLIRSRRGYRTHLKQLFCDAEEIIERCDNDSPEIEDSARLAELIEQLERKRTILTDLDRKITCCIDMYTCLCTHAQSVYVRQ